MDALQANAGPMAPLQSSSVQRIAQPGRVSSAQTPIKYQTTKPGPRSDPRRPFNQRTTVSINRKKEAAPSMFMNSHENFDSMAQQMPVPAGAASMGRRINMQQNKRDNTGLAMHLAIYFF